MNQPVNLMPWRQTRRAACVRFWRLLFAASLLVVVGIALRYWGALHEDARIARVLLQGEKECAAALLASKPRLLQRQQRWRQALRRQQQREQTLRWRSVLENLAIQIPEQAWLTHLAWQHNALELSGKALTFASLGELDASLRRQRDFRISRTGATQQDARRRWQFQYQLTRTQADEHSY